MVDEGPKRLSIAEKRALSAPLVLEPEDELVEPSAAVVSTNHWTNAVLPEQSRKTLISLRVDPAVLEFFKAQGPGYQTRMNAVLTAYMQVKKEYGES